MSTNNFWSGFSLGALFCGVSFYFIGTKDGRQNMRKILDVAENFEESTSDFIHDFQEEFEEKKELFNKHTFSPASTSGNLEQVIDKIKSVFPAKKETKRYFVKNGKIVK